MGWGKIVPAIWLASMTLVLSSCGGAGGGGNGGGTAGSPTPTIAVTSSPVQGNASVTEGNTGAIIHFTATTVPPSTITTPVIANLGVDDPSIESATVTAGNAPNTYEIAIQFKADLSGGDHQGAARFRLCQETSCAHIYPGSTISLNYAVHVDLLDWTTFQRSASRAGYVNVSLDPSRFRLAWTWEAPVDPLASNSLEGIVTAGGVVYVTQPTSIERRHASLFALSDADGHMLWSRTYDNQFFMSPPSYAGRKLWVQSSQIGNGYAYFDVISLDAANGQQLSREGFSSQIANYLASAPIGSQVIFPGGALQSEVNSYDQFSAALLWQAMTQRLVPTEQAPSADSQYVYENDGAFLHVFRVLDGSPFARIQYDPMSSAGNSSQIAVFGSPIAAGGGRVFSYYGSGESDWDPYYNARKLIAFDVPNGAVIWTSARGYMTTPAYARGIVYAGRETLDAIDGATGSVLWSWTPPGADRSCVKNIVATNNLVFVATDVATYAIDIQSHQSVWSFGDTGALAISPNYKLYIVGGDDVYTAPLDQRLSAISLN